VAAVANLTDLVTADEIRAMLGVEVKELPDSKIDLPVYLRSVKLAVGRLDTQRRYWDAFEALPGSGMSDVQQRFSDAFLTFAGWKAASLLAVSLPQFSPRSITDGKASFQRQPNSPMDTYENVNTQLGSAEFDLVAAAADLLPPADIVVTTDGLMARVSLGAADPITG
jgi:hypothetical protein